MRRRISFGLGGQTRFQARKLGSLILGHVILPFLKDIIIIVIHDVNTCGSTLRDECHSATRTRNVCVRVEEGIKSSNVTATTESPTWKGNRAKRVEILHAGPPRNLADSDKWFRKPRRFTPTRISPVQMLRKMFVVREGRINF